MRACCIERSHSKMSENFLEILESSSKMSEKFYSNFQEINDASDNLVKDHIIRFNDRVCLSQKQSLVAVPVYEINYTFDQVKVFRDICT